MSFPFLLVTAPKFAPFLLRFSSEPLLLSAKTSFTTPQTPLILAFERCCGNFVIKNTQSNTPESSMNTCVEGKHPYRSYVIRNEKNRYTLD